MIWLTGGSQPDFKTIEDSRRDNEVAIQATCRLLALLCVRACWSTPIKGADGAVLGTFAIYDADNRVPTSGDLDMIASITQTAALAIERHRSEMALRRSRDELEALNAHLERQVAERSAERDRAWSLLRELPGVVETDGTLAAVNPAWTTVLGWQSRTRRTNLCRIHLS